jgi:hypothetical protein
VSECWEGKGGGGGGGEREREREREKGGRDVFCLSLLLLLLLLWVCDKHHHHHPFDPEFCFRELRMSHMIQKKINFWDLLLFSPGRGPPPLGGPHPNVPYILILTIVVVVHSHLSS